MRVGSEIYDFSSYRLASFVGNIVSYPSRQLMEKSFYALAKAMVFQLATPIRDVLTSQETQATLSSAQLIAYANNPFFFSNHDLVSMDNLPNNAVITTLQMENFSVACILIGSWSSTDLISSTFQCMGIRGMNINLSDIVMVGFKGMELLWLDKYP